MDCAVKKTSDDGQEMSQSQIYANPVYRNIKSVVYLFTEECVLYRNISLNFIMPPTLEKLKGHIAFGLSVRACVRSCVRYKIY